MLAAVGCEPGSNKDHSLPLWVPIVCAVGGVLLLVIVVLWCRCRRTKDKPVQTDYYYSPSAAVYRITAKEASPLLGASPATLGGGPKMGASRAAVPVVVESTAPAHRPRGDTS